MKLMFNALIKFVCGILIVGLLVFLPAGTVRYSGGWMFMCALFVPVLILGLLLFLKSPELLKKRLDGREEQTAQKGVVAFTGLIFTVGFLVSGFDFRYGWSYVPLAVQIVAVVLFLTAYCIYAEVMRENAYLSRTVKVEENQKIVDTGLYRVVRHPMYAATVLLFLMIPLILGSWWAFAVFLCYPVIIAVRIKNEEKLLENELDGYAQYKKKVKYKMIPFIW